MPKKVSKRKGPGRVGPAKIRDVEYLSWLKATLNEGWLTASMIHTLALEHFKDRVDPTGSEGVKPDGIGGAIRRLLPAHCSAFPHRLRGDDLFTYEDGLWSLKADAAQASTPAEAQVAA